MAHVCLKIWQVFISGLLLKNKVSPRWSVCLSVASMVVLNLLIFHPYFQSQHLNNQLNWAVVFSCT